VLFVLFLFWVAMGSRSLLCLEIDLSNGMQMPEGVLQ
jgi:hypothetical protein